MREREREGKRVRVKIIGSEREEERKMRKRQKEGKKVGAMIKGDEKEETDR